MGFYVPGLTRRSNFGSDWPFADGSSARQPAPKHQTVSSLPAGRDGCSLSAIIPRAYVRLVSVANVAPFDPTIFRHPCGRRLKRSS